MATTEYRHSPPPRKEENVHDAVNHPAHYTAGGVETIDFIEAKQLNYHLGNCVKYISRAGLKSTDPIEDLRKARWYLDREIFRISNQSGG